MHHHHTYSRPSSVISLEGLLLCSWFNQLSILYTFSESLRRLLLKWAKGRKVMKVWQSTDTIRGEAEDQNNEGHHHIVKLSRERRNHSTGKVKSVSLMGIYHREFPIPHFLAFSSVSHALSVRPFIYVLPPWDCVSPHWASHSITILQVDVVWKGEEEEENVLWLCLIRIQKEERTLSLSLQYSLLFCPTAWNSLGTVAKQNHAPLLPATHSPAATPPLPPRLAPWYEHVSVICHSSPSLFITRHPTPLGKRLSV